MIRGKIRLIFVLCLFLLVGVLHLTAAIAATIRIPSDQPTIQAGINAAVPGDTVLVAPGTYSGTGNTSLLFNGKAITVQSENGPATCIINGRGFRFFSNEGLDSVVSGFTIRDGYGQGSGVYCEGASPTIDNCVIKGHNHDGIGENGTGVYCLNSSARFTNCVIEDNFADWDGGGMALDNSSPWLFKCTFYKNRAWTGGGLLCTNSSPRIDNCKFIENRASISQCGGGLAVEGLNSYPIITNSVFTGNRSGCGAGALIKNFASAELVNSSFVGNRAITSNGGGIVIYNTSAISLTNSILWGNTAVLEGPQIYNNNSSLTVSFSDVDQEGYGNSGGGADAAGNIRMDPLFRDISCVDSIYWDLNLQASSPCIDAATSDGAPVSDLEGRSRYDDPGTMNTGGGTITYYDMGAFEHIPACEGNFDYDNDIDVSDLAIFAADFGKTNCSGGCDGDYNHDLDVDGWDLAIIAADYGRTDCPIPDIDYWVSASSGSNTNPGTFQAPFLTITHALDIAETNAVIKVLPGTYNGPLGETFPLILKPGQELIGDEINKGLGTIPTRIRGQGAFTAAIFDYATLVGAEDARMSGFDVGVDGYQNFHVCIAADGITMMISDNTFRTNTYGGVLLANEGATLVKDNVFNTSSYGAYVFYCPDGPIIQQNEFFTFLIPIDITGPSTYAIISDNTINSGYSVGIQVQRGFPRIENNTFDLASGYYSYGAIRCQNDDAQPTLRKNVFICQSTLNNAIRIDGGNPDMGTANESGQNDFSTNAGMAISHNGPTTVYAIGNTWRNDPPVEDDDIEVSGIGSVVWGTGPNDYFP